MHTWTGIDVDLANFDSSMVNLTDIARSLRHLHRFNGHIKCGFSVLEHSIIGSMLAETPEQQLEALLHDAGEAYVGDIILPLKEVFPAVCELEDKITTIIFDTYWPTDCPHTSTGVYKKSPYMIKLDRDMACWESAWLRPHHGSSPLLEKGNKAWIAAYNGLHERLRYRDSAVIEDIFYRILIELQNEVYSK